LEFRVDKPKPKDKAFLDQVAPKFAEDLTKAIVTLRQIVEQQQPFTAVIDEPPLPPSNERFLNRAGEIKRNKLNNGCATPSSWRSRQTMLW
jgi:hypothetical protein